MKPEVLIIGAGIVGAALAECCARHGLRTLVLDSGLPGAGTTAAGMGHLVTLDGSAAELALSSRGLRLWQARRADLPAAAAYSACGTLWLARDEAEMHEAERKHAILQASTPARLLNRSALYAAEPNLAGGLQGGLLLPDEAVIYPPAACHWLLEQAQSLGAGLISHCPVAAVEDGSVVLGNGHRIRADRVVLAAGCQSRNLLPELPLLPRKGQLVITERYAGLVRHQLVELGYLQSAHGDGDSVAFNVQPRPTGQLLIGSSRESSDSLDPELNWPLLQRMLRRAFDYLPALQAVQAIRCWSGFRPATPDKQPLLGRAVGYQKLWLATGHEGLGVTTALASAELLSALMLDQAPAIDPAPFDPARFSRAAAAIPCLQEANA
ncbi:NAD(P)/FAD-dependent oxidoreductase [Chitinimonas sp.]|uniref:NAD(P)/FAD-dependent oxidoreductase n=1 Tax=Chitinimonas sp. TaxID=1934313 RepID=UPI0035AF1DD8